MTGLDALRPFVGRPRAQVCELCSAGLASAHSHLADVEGRRLVCVCGPCGLLFERDGAARGRFRSIPSRVRRLDLQPAAFEALQIPVGVAFLVRGQAAARWSAFFPGPGGATESMLPLEIADELAAEVGGELADDVEALLVRGSGEAVEAYVVPIDVCYELAGRVRRAWRGIDGGPSVAAEVEGVFTGLARRTGR